VILAPPAVGCFRRAKCWLGGGACGGRRRATFYPFPASTKRSQCLSKNRGCRPWRTPNVLIEKGFPVFRSNRFRRILGVSGSFSCKLIRRIRCDSLLPETGFQEGFPAATRAEGRRRAGSVPGAAGPDPRHAPFTGEAGGRSTRAFSKSALGRFTRACPELDSGTCRAVRPCPRGVPVPAKAGSGLAILKHTYDLSDEGLCDRWVENP